MTNLMTPTNSQKLCQVCVSNIRHWNLNVLCQLLYVQYVRQLSSVPVVLTPPRNLYRVVIVFLYSSLLIGLRGDIDQEKKIRYLPDV